MTRPRSWTAFNALRDRNFRWLWAGLLAFSAGLQIGNLAQGWLVYEITGSAFALASVSSVWGISTLLLSLYGEAIADRVEKRDLLVWIYFASALNALAVALLVSTDAIRIWHLIACSLLSGALFSFMMPASQAILPELVVSETLLNAISLNSTGMGLIGILSVSVAGYVVEAVGAGGAYYVIAAFYLIALATLMRLPRTGRRARSPTSVWAGLWRGVRYVQADTILVALVFLTLAQALLIVPYRSLMPAFTQEAMGLDASGLGMLMAAPGVGALVSSLVTASLGDFRGKGKLLLMSGIVMGGSLFLFALIPFTAFVLLFLVLAGAADNACMVTTIALLQVNSDDKLRGRVMSIYTMVWGMTPLGILPAGAIADGVGVRFASSLEGVLLAMVFPGMGILRPGIRKLE